MNPGDNALERAVLSVLYAGETSHLAVSTPATAKGAGNRANVAGARKVRSNVVWSHANKQKA